MKRGCMVGSPPMNWIMLIPVAAAWWQRERSLPPDGTFHAVKVNNPELLAVLVVVEQGKG